MGVAFLVGAVVPLLPYILITTPHYDLGAALAATALTCSGSAIRRMARASRRALALGMRFLAIAMGAAAAGYLIGLAISPLGATAG